MAIKHWKTLHRRASRQEIAQNVARESKVAIQQWKTLHEDAETTPRGAHSGAGTAGTEMCNKYIIKHYYWLSTARSLGGGNEVLVPVAPESKVAIKCWHPLHRRAMLP